MIKAKKWKIVAAGCLLSIVALLMLNFTNICREIQVIKIKNELESNGFTIESMHRQGFVTSYEGRLENVRELEKINPKIFENYDVKEYLAEDIPKNSRMIYFNLVGIIPYSEQALEEKTMCDIIQARCFFTGSKLALAYIVCQAPYNPRFEVLTMFFPFETRLDEIEYVLYGE